MANSCLTVDPSIISPHIFSSSKDFEKYLALVSSLGSLKESVVIDVNFISYLANVDLFPLQHNLKSLLIFHEIDYVDENSLARILNELIVNSSTFDDDLLYEERHFKISSIDCCSCHPQIGVFFIDTLKYLCALSVVNESAIKILGPSQASGDPIVIECSFETILYGNRSVHVEDLNIHELRPGVPIEAVDEELSFRAKWVESNYSESVFCSLLKLHLEQRGVGDEVVKKLRIGADFYEDINVPEIISSEMLFDKVIEAIYEIASQTQVRKTHAIRESGSGGSKAYKVDGYSAFRHDVTYDFHLHYWRKSNFEIEIANVNHHNVFSISKHSG